MSVTILKTVGTWQGARDPNRNAIPHTPLRGRVITGLLTVEDPDPPLAVASPRPDTARGTGST